MLPFSPAPTSTVESQMDSPFAAVVYLVFQHPGKPPPFISERAIEQPTCQRIAEFTNTHRYSERDIGQMLSQIREGENEAFQALGHRGLCIL